LRANAARGLRKDPSRIDVPTLVNHVDADRILPIIARRLDCLPKVRYFL